MKRFDIQRLRDLSIVIALSTVLALMMWAKLVSARRSANDASAIGDTRSVISANETYASVNCGLYAESLECLTHHGDRAICIPNYPREAPEFLGEDLARPSPYSKNGYWRHYEGFNAPDVIPSKCAPRSVTSYCYASWPIHHGLTGVRSFVGTSSEIYEDPDGGGVRCILLESRDGRNWGPPPNAHPIGGPYLEKRRRMENLSRSFWSFQWFFWPVCLVLAGIALARGRLNKPTQVLLLVGIAAILALLIMAFAQSMIRV
jgi:hypothetical protein